MTGINLNTLSNDDLVNHVERELDRYEATREQLETPYGSTELWNIQTYSKQLQRCLYDSEKAQQVYARVESILAEIMPKPVQKKVLNMYEYNQRMNQRFNSRA